VIALVCLEAPVPGRASRAALELACGLAGSAEVFALSACGPLANAAVEVARARAGVTRILHIETATVDQTDFLTMGMILGEAARHLGASLVITGERSDEEGQGLVPAALAHHLRAPLLSRVQAVRPASQPNFVEVTLRAGGLLCTLNCPLPAVLSTPPGTTGLPVAAAAEPCVVELLPLAQLGLDASRLVPRPDLLGQLVPAPTSEVRRLGLGEATAAIERHV
jgi:electron transfer flavoprotein beta subunit